MKINANDAWVFYQFGAGISMIVVAIAVTIFVYYAVRFMKSCEGTIKDIERNTRVVKTDILMKKRKEALARLENVKIQNVVKDEDHFRP